MKIPEPIQYLHYNNRRDLNLLIIKNAHSNAVIRVPIEVQRSEFIVFVELKK